MNFERLTKVSLWRLIGPAVVIAAVFWVGPGKVWAALSKADFRFVAAACFMAVPLSLIKGIRWKILLGSYDICLSFRDSTGMYAVGMVLSAVTPGRIGDFVKIVLLTKKGCSIGKAIAANIFDRLFDIGFVLLAGYCGMWYFSENFASQLNVINIVFGASLVLLVVFMLKGHLIKKMAIKLVPARYRPVARQSWNEIVGGFLNNRVGRFLGIILWTAVFWLLQFYAIYLCSMSLSVGISFIYLSACAAVAAVLSLLPITVAGLGTRDAVFILLLGQMGIARQQSLALSVLVLVVFLVNCAVFYIISVIFRSE
jgi:uncharacterized protein (TIRG00374 family)